MGIEKSITDHLMTNFDLDSNFYSNSENNDENNNNSFDSKKN